ncbi:MAG: preprotein translocase subunit SecG [Phycisphaerales bacterium]|nr:preprotein translocase subunit SecG [Phycisphaerales bacterium]
MIDTLAQMGVKHYLVATLFILICLLLMLVVLLQKGRGGGLSGAFGGGGGHSAFGAKTGDVFTWITVALAAGFVIVACIGTFVFIPEPLATTPPPMLVPVGDETPGADGSTAAPQPSSAEPTTEQGE